MTITFVGKVLDPHNPTNFSGVNRRFFGGRPQFGIGVPSAPCTEEIVVW